MSLVLPMCVPSLVMKLMLICKEEFGMRTKKLNKFWRNKVKINDQIEKNLLS